jgi:outer membrane protein OmpA-like peptidoglycan-associated protein
MSRSLRALALGAVALVSVAATPAEAPVQDLTLPVIDLDLQVSSLDRSIARGESAKEVRVRLAADVLFAFNSAKLSSRAQSRIDEAAKDIEDENADSVRIVGYTDSKGSPGFNLGLSRRRANAVRQALAKQVKGTTLAAEGRGESNPVASNTKADGSDSPKGRALNRRVEILIPKS